MRNCQLADTQPHKISASQARTVRIASAIWAGSIFLSRIMGLVREQIIGRTLGASRQTDIYFASFTLPDFLYYLMAAGALSIVFIPIYLRVVDGVTPTKAGLLMLPLMIGIIVSSISSGKAPTVPGRYKPFPIAGTALMVVGLAVVTVVVAAGLAVGTDARTRSRGDLTLAPPIALHGDRTVLPARAA